MKKLINDPLRVVEEMIEGLVLADERLTRLEGENVVLRRDHRALANAGKVALISGGGAGHEPAHAGYVGKGMLTAAVVGAVFTSPSVDAVLAAIKAVAGPAGVLLIIKNYTGDRLNFGLAAEFARAEGVAVDIVIVHDDVALDADGGAVGRRGIAGTVLVHKVAGAAAEAGLTWRKSRRKLRRLAPSSSPWAWASVHALFRPPAGGDSNSATTRLNMDWASMERAARIAVRSRQPIRC